MTPKVVLATFALLLVILTFAEGCGFGRDYSCAPDQWACSRMRGKCMVQAGGCRCVPLSVYYDQWYTGSQGNNYASYQPYRPYREPEGHGPGGTEAGSGMGMLSEGAIERQTNMMIQMTRMYNLMTRR